MALEVIQPELIRAHLREAPHADEGRALVRVENKYFVGSGSLGGPSMISHFDARGVERCSSR